MQHSEKLILSAIRAALIKSAEEDWWKPGYNVVDAVLAESIISAELEVYCCWFVWWCCSKRM